MATRLTPRERARLVGVLSRLSSPFDGERAAAGLLASRLLNAAGLGWDDLLVGGEPAHSTSPQWQQQSRPGWYQDWRRDVALCLSHLSALTAWEAQFARGLHARARTPSTRQLEVLREIAGRIRAMAGAATP